MMLARSAFFEAVVIDQDDPSEPLRLSPMSGKPWAMSLSVTERVNGLGSIQVELQFDSYSQAIQFLDSRFLKIGNTVSVRWGYTEGKPLLSPWHYGFLRKPEVSFGESMSVTISAECLGWNATRYQDRVIWNGLEGEKWSRMRIIRHLAEKYGLTLVARLDGESEKVLNDTKAIIAQGGLNDWAFIRLLASEAGCYTWISRGVELHLVSASLMGADPAPVCTFRYFGQVDFDAGVFPAFSFESDTTALFLPQRGRFGWIEGRDKRARKREEDESTSREAAVSGKEAVSQDPGGRVKVRFVDRTATLGKRYDEKRGGSRHWPVLRRDLEVDKRSGKTIARVGQWTFDVTNAETAGLSAQVRSIDVPYLRPGDLVAVEGVGKFFSVKYRAWEIARTYGDGGAEMDVKLIPKGLPPGVFAKVLRVTSSAANPHESRPEPQPRAGTVTKEAKSGE